MSSCSAGVSPATGDEDVAAGVKAMDARSSLLSFLDEKTFNPALKADPNRYPGRGKGKLLARVRRKVRETQIRYHGNYATGAEVKDRFFQDLASDYGQAPARDMWQLHMTRFEDIVDEFKALCDSLGV